MRLNKVQRAAYELIQADARFLYTLVDMSQNASNISSNYIMMCQPYIGIFADGAEQWCKKLGLKAPLFNEQEKNYYDALRQSHKLLEKTYSEYANLLMSKLAESDQYFYSIRSLREKVFGYYNVGTDLFNGEYCGNTILGAAYIPMPLLSNQNVSIMIKDLSVIVGELAGFFGCKAFAPYLYDDKGNTVECKDFHFFNNCPLKEKNELGVVLFSILCNINYATVFIENFFLEEIPQKFKFAYLQYYYLCDFVNELRLTKGTNYSIDDALQNRELRNCLAHYGLGQYLEEKDIIETDILKGLTEEKPLVQIKTAKTQKHLYCLVFTKGYYTNLFTLSAALPSQYGSGNTDRKERIFSLVESVRSFFMSCGLSVDSPWTIRRNRI